MNYLAEFAKKVDSELGCDFDITFNISMDNEFSIVIWFDGGEISHFTFMAGDGYQDSKTFNGGQIVSDVIDADVFPLFVDKLELILSKSEELIDEYGDGWTKGNDTDSYSKEELATEYARDFLFSTRAVYIHPVLNRLKKIKELCDKFEK